MPFTIKDGTSQEGESLCLTCVHVHMQRGFRESEEEVFCTFGPLRPVCFKVRECTDFCSRVLPTRWEMEKIALIIPTHTARKAAGFKGVGFAGEEAEAEEVVSTME
jgi:hypothetical protein